MRINVNMRNPKSTINNPKWTRDDGDNIEGQ
jgi:hypothetical protein